MSKEITIAIKHYRDLCDCKDCKIGLAALLTIEWIFGTYHGPHCSSIRDLIQAKYNEFREAL